MERINGFFFTPQTFKISQVPDSCYQCKLYHSCIKNGEYQKPLPNSKVERKKTGVQMEVTADTSDATMHIEKEDETSKDDGDDGSTQDGDRDKDSITTPSTNKDNPVKKTDEDSDSITSNKEDNMSICSISMEAKACDSPPTTYLDAVLNGKFNSFHILGKHRENLMMRERVQTSYDASKDTFQHTGSAARYLQCVSM